MHFSERTVEPPAHWPTVEELERAATSDVLVMLPEQLDERDGVVTAFFRSEAQALRVKALEGGLTPLMLAPQGAEIAGYSEFAADWVLPVIVAAGLAFPIQIAADLVADRIEGTSHQQAAPLIVRYREAVIDDGRARLLEIEGPAEEVERILRERAATLQLPP